MKKTFDGGNNQPMAKLHRKFVAKQLPTAHGEILTTKDLADRSGFALDTVRAKLRDGWDADAIIRAGNARKEACAEEDHQ